MKRPSGLFGGRSAARRTMFLVAGMAAFVCLASPPAAAYVGPGAGIALFGALWAVILAVVFAFAGILIWPVRAFLRRRKGAAGTAIQGRAAETDGDETP